MSGSAGPAPGASLSEPLRGWFDAAREHEGVVRERFEVSSHGDLVPGTLDRPAVPGPHPVVVVAGDPSLPHEEALAPFRAADLAVARIDLPLAGARESVKLSERVMRSVDGASEATRFDDALLADWFAQAVGDLCRVVGWLRSHPEVDADRIAVVGFGRGATAARACAAAEPTVRATAAVDARGRAPQAPPLDRPHLDHPGSASLAPVAAFLTAQLGA